MFFIFLVDGLTHVLTYLFYRLVLSLFLEIAFAFPPYEVDNIE